MVAGYEGIIYKGEKTKETKTRFGFLAEAPKGRSAAKQTCCLCFKARGKLEWSNWKRLDKSHKLYRYNLKIQGEKNQTGVYIIFV